MTARLWTAADGRLLGSPLRHQGRVIAVAFSPDGNTVLTGSDDMKARIWDVASGRLRLEPPPARRSRSQSLPSAPMGVR